MTDIAIREIIGSLVVLLGAFFLFSAGLGVLRMPDAYTRIQAGTKATTLGNLLVLLGLGIHNPDWALKLLLIAGFVLMTNPVSSHALSRAAHRIGIPMARSTVTDALRDDEQREAERRNDSADASSGTDTDTRADGGRA
ncbi:monovalent cation/H(+) antiporter subunit G [Pseudochelatococcus contaminans]|uniref:Multicomponent Na+:H+ antiporter subunit G n=1 Tax=Pseudochelatococcus contaminans TaxID=1538103 RepID=A0A7W5Z3T5_9HYPH|nr:monovalent cation/H(+) antiporter subunit G [Pseudochelatococcus contaminans]MBB3809459.1 multicomponent Na+:H+ antiporter subunit G [Pseudochelatococcus contaminans]